MRNATLKVGEAFETSHPGVFAAGDCVSGPATVIEAVAQGHKVALAVDHYLRTGKGERVVYQPKRHLVPMCWDVTEYAEARRAQPKVLAPEERRACGFGEVELGFDEAAARAEAHRCLRCDLEWCQLVGLEVPQLEPEPVAQPAGAEAAA